MPRMLLTSVVLGLSVACATAAPYSPQEDFDLGCTPGVAGFSMGAGNDPFHAAAMDDAWWQHVHRKMREAARREAEQHRRMCERRELARRERERHAPPASSPSREKPWPEPPGPGTGPVLVSIAMPPASPGGQEPATGGASDPNPLVTLVRQGRHQEVQRALDEHSTLKRDDASNQLVQALSDDELERLARSDEGNLLLGRLLDEVTSGHVSAEEGRQAVRLLGPETRRRHPSPDDFAAATLHARIFSYEPMGATHWGAPLDAKRRPDGKIEVHLTSRTFGNDYRRDAFTLYGRDYVLEPDEVVGVRMYDEGSLVTYDPALLLVQLSNADDVHTAEKMVEMAALGATLGACGPEASAAEASSAARASASARAVAVCDRVALAVGLATSAVLEHRYWVLSRFGEDGRDFLRGMEILNSALAFYAVGRVAKEAPNLARAMRQFYGPVVAQARLQRKLAWLTPQQVKELDDFLADVEKLFGSLETIRLRPPDAGAVEGQAPLPQTGGNVIPLDRLRQAGQAPEAGAESWLVEAEESLAPTGTDGPSRRQGAPGGDAPVASLKRPGQGGTTEAGRGRAPELGGGPGASTQAPSTFRSAPPAAPGERPAGANAAEREAPWLRVLPGGAEVVEEVTEEQLAALKFSELEESAAPGERLAGDTEQVRRQRPTRRPPGVLEGDSTWERYLKYFDKRLEELEAHDKGLLAKRPENPVPWTRYEVFQGNVARGIAFQKKVKAIILAEQALPPESRIFTYGMRKPRFDSNLGVQKGSETVKFVDMSITDLDSIGPGKTPELVHVSVKSPDCRGMSIEEAEAIARQHYNELVAKYGGRMEVRRPGHPLFDQEVEVTRLHLVYEAMYIEEKVKAAIVNVLRGKSVTVHFK